MCSGLGGCLLGGLASGRDVAAEIAGVCEGCERGHGKLGDLAAGQRNRPARVAKRDLKIDIEQTGARQGNKDLHIAPLRVGEGVSILLGDCCEPLPSDARMPSTPAVIAPAAASTAERSSSSSGSWSREGHQSVELAGTEKREVLGRQQLRELGVADRGRVRERLLEQPVSQEPLRGSPVKLRHGFRTRSGKLDPQKLAEQVVVAIPDPTRIERDQEQVRPLDLGQNPSGALGTRTASHSFAVKRSRIDVLSRKLRVSSSIASSTSDVR